MRLQKQLSRRVGKTEYPKWVVTLPTKTIELVGWEAGKELEAVIKDGKIILKPKEPTS